MFRMITLVACWSHDYWCDITHDDPEMRSEDEGPSRYEIDLVRSWSTPPSDQDVAIEVSWLHEDYFPFADGHSELHSYAVLDDAQWESMLKSIDRPPTRDLTEENAPDAWHYEGRWRPVEVSGWLNFEKWGAIMQASGATISETTRGRLPENAPATIDYFQTD